MGGVQAPVLMGGIGTPVPVCEISDGALVGGVVAPAIVDGAGARLLAWGVEAPVLVGAVGGTGCNSTGPCICPVWDSRGLED